MKWFKKYKIEKVSDKFYAIKQRMFPWKWETVDCYFNKYQAECELLRREKALKYDTLFRHYCYVKPKDKIAVVEKLCNIGYKPSMTFDIEQKYIFTSQNGLYYSTNNPYLDTFGDEETRMVYDKLYGIYCADNDDLFLAIAAVNDRNDYMQWFYSEVYDCDGNQLPHHVFLCNQETLEKFGWINNSPNSYKSGVYKKIGINGLIDYFVFGEKDN
jgi:hypothetical protein